MISCHLYDYIEIVCMHKYPVKLTMKNNTVIKCIALDTKYNDAREECIKVSCKSTFDVNMQNIKKVDNTTESLIPLNNLASLEVVVENPHFKVVSFS
ncbi:Rho-binding antiterminator [Pseudocolwellia sp. HL-MZ19]|uniref:Rho-binding antiterminator n=1 Tax=unclassified Pseudocolwellia TaxID=2848178 RepID=UPI003CEC61A0